MKVEISFTCTNDDCAARGEQEAIDDFFILRLSDAEFQMVYQSTCPQCKTVGKLSISHGETRFSSVHALEEYLKGLIREVTLLTKLVQHGIADDTETTRYREGVELLEGVICPCCGRTVDLDTKHVPSRQLVK